MPTYSFECPTCGKITEKFYASYKLRPGKVDCDECSNPAHFVIDAPAIHWHHTPKDPLRRVPSNPVKAQVPLEYYRKKGGPNPSITPNFNEKTGAPDTKIVPTPEAERKKYRRKGRPIHSELRKKRRE